MARAEAFLLVGGERCKTRNLEYHWGGKVPWYEHDIDICLWGFLAPAVVCCPAGSNACELCSTLFCLCVSAVGVNLFTRTLSTTIQTPRLLWHIWQLFLAAQVMSIFRSSLSCCCVQPSQKTYKIKRVLARKAKQNRPIPQWIRFRTGNKIR